MMTEKTPEASVLVSLVELAEIEEERIRDEERQSAHARAERARERQRAEQERREAAAARARAEAQARARREREQAEAQVRAAARQQAAIEVSRIEAEAKARLEADNALRAHELALVRARTERSGRRWQRGLAAVLGLVLCGSAAGAYGFTRHVTALEQESQHLREEQHSLVQAHQGAMKAELAALDRRHAALDRRSVAADVGPCREAAEAARRAVHRSSLDAHKLGAFRDALEVWQARSETRERLAQLERRQADLVAWAAKQRHPELLQASQRAAARAHAAGADERALVAYEQSLDELRQALVANGSASGRHRPGSKPPVRSGGRCTHPRDPMCGLDGKPLRVE